VGTLVVWGTGWGGGAVLAAFFVPSTLISRGTPAPPELDPKEGRRDAHQVLANGAVGALASLAGLWDHRLGLWLLTCTLAAAAADTWATSLGARSSTSPRLLWSSRSVPRGTNGAITPLGCAGALVGAAVVAVTSVAAGGSRALLLAAVLIGFAGMVSDSWLGASLQGRFHCPACDRDSEWPVHRCGTATIHRGGVRWLDNDLVNLTATAVAAALGFVVWAWRCPCP
jgi:uncharacterized protein (TIGR00297 family)